MATCTYMVHPPHRHHHCFFMAILLFLKTKKNNSGINVMHRENDVFSASQQTTLQTKTI